jgi:maltose/moltooligosaccharide transporter
MLPFQQKRTNAFFALLALPATAVGFSLSTQIAVLSWILSTKYDLHIEDVALVWLAGPISGIIAQPIVGAISDKSWFWGGRRRPFIAIGGILGGLMMLGLLNLDAIAAVFGLKSVFLVAVVVSLLLDMSINVTFNPARAIIADLTPVGPARTKGYSWMQMISGSFSIGAYFISVAFGNVALMYVAAGLVFLFSILPLFFIEEPRHLESPEAGLATEKTNFSTQIKLLLPLYGFIVYGLFVVANKLFLANSLEKLQIPLMFACLLGSVFLGVYIVIKGRRRYSDETEFQKIMLAHSFTWLGVQSMFVMSFFYIQHKIIPGAAAENVLANTFSTFFSGTVQSAENSAGNILSLGFLLLNFVGALLPILVLEPMAQRIGTAKTYLIALGFMVFGYYFLYFFGVQEINFYVGMLLCGVGWSAVISIIFAILTEKIDTSKMGQYMGLFNSCVVLPAMMTVGVSTWVCESGDYATLFLMAGLSLSVSFVFWFFVKEKK